MKQLKTKFWYESNACWGYIKSLKDLQEKCTIQTGEYGAVKNVEEFLDISRESGHEELNFGTRNEHRGRTLREYLKEINELDNFLK